ncbi:hypothetical protein ABBQ38_001991 [Trebouxia sp. C0009 RCD-2024]
MADLCTEAGRQQADSIIVSFFSADNPSGMFKQLPTDLAAQQTLLSSVDKQLPAEAQQACEGPDEGITGECDPRAIALLMTQLACAIVAYCESHILQGSVATA